MFRYRLSMIAAICGFITCLADETHATRRALIIACSEFPLAPSVAPLPGAANDAIRFRQLLTSEKYAFDEVESLVGWQADSDLNPTAENIAAAFERLIAATQSGDQVFILMSGHGLQVKPIAKTSDTLGAVEEPDGMDEAFVAADYGPKLKVIRDDQIGEWLSQLKARQAHTWIVFDCCHSGSLTRGDDDENQKRILTIDAEASRETRVANPKSAPDTGFLDLSTNRIEDKPTNSAGSLVALFAAQNYETTPEVTRPPGAEKVPANRRGLLSFHLEYLLHNASGQTTYRDLENALAARYAAERGMGGPNPYFEGDSDRRLFGLATIDSPVTMRLSKRQAQWILHGGVMDGVVIGAILDVSREGQVIGEIEATEVGLNTSTARWLSEEPKDDATQSLALRCRMTKQPINPWKVSLEWVSASDASEEVPKDEKELREWTRELNDSESSPITLEGNGAGAVWSLCVATPQQARERFGVPIERTSVLLLSDNLTSPPSGRPARSVQPDEYQFAAYAVDDLAAVKAKLTVDFDRLFRVQRLLQLAGLYGEAGPMISTRGVSLDFLPLRRESSGDATGHPVDRRALVSGEELVVELSSKKPVPLWYTAMLIESNGLILPVFSGSIPKGTTSTPSTRSIERIRVKLTRNTSAYVAITVPVKDSRTPANFSYLAQPPIGVHDRSRNADQSSDEITDRGRNESYLGALLLGTSRSTNDSGFAIRQDGSQIAVRTWSVIQE